MAMLTAVSLLAMDMYLPAVPAMQKDLGLSVSMGQATVAAFLVGLAASQLAWGECFSRFGPRFTAVLGAVLLLLSSAAAALAADGDLLIGWRLVQGVGAGASTVVVPGVVRAHLPERLATKGLGVVAMIESVVPAVGPVIGAGALLFTGWRGVFGLIAVVVLLMLPLVALVTPNRLAGQSATGAGAGGYHALLRNPKVLRPALTHGLSFAALFVFVASAPQMLSLSAGLGPGAFAVLQLAGVGGFIVATALTGRWTATGRLQPEAMVAVAAKAQLGLTALWAASGLFVTPGLVWLVPFWVAFCMLLGVRGPATMAMALSVAPDQMGRAAGLLMLITLSLCAGAAQLTAVFLEQHPVASVEIAMLVLLTLSLLAWGPARRRSPLAPRQEPAP